MPVNSSASDILAYNQLEKIVDALDNNSVSSAEKALAELSENLRYDSTDDVSLGRFFKDALEKRILRNNWTVPNLYLLNDNQQQIHYFNLMSKAFPLVILSQKMIRETILEVIGASTSVLIMDIGIGTAQQIKGIIESLYSRQAEIPVFRVIGIEPSQNNLEKAYSELTKLSLEYDFQLEFIALNTLLEDMTESDWQNITELYATHSGISLINASFSLHHVRISDRTTLIARLKSLNPGLLTVIEPDAHYLTNSLSEKFRNAWSHYHLTFQVIEEMQISDSEKAGLKTVFFGREIQDVFSEQSIEQYETGTEWSSRFQNAGFTKYQQELNKAGLKSGLNSVSVTDKGNFVSIDVHGKPVVSMMTFQTGN